MKNNSIPDQHYRFASEMLSQTIGNLCREKTHIGLCD